jgi:two-component system NtrC family response regulator
MEKLLIVDDNEDLRKQLKWGFGKDYEVLLASDGKEALSILKKCQPKVVTLDLGLPPDGDGTEEGFACLEEILRQASGTKVIVITGNDDKNNALRAINLGAYDFFQKPLDIKTLKVIVKRAFNLRHIEEENSRLQISLAHKYTGMGGIIGQCARMMQVFATIRKVASANAAIFVVGESGTGKELVARAIHALSLRATGPFIPIDCGAIPENLLESELFGFEKGAFTGAHARVQGKVEYAHKGTLFLDEIGELPASLQVKLLRFLQEKVLQRVGGREDIASDTRIISATNRDIAKAVQAGKFREDLYYRIAVITISLPPLREREEDIMLLANLFLKRFGEQFNKQITGFSAAAVATLESYDWPGNVRELENKIQRAIIMSDSPILEPETLGFPEPPAFQSPALPGNLNLKAAKDRLERDMVVTAMECHGGNMAKAAEQLGISRPTLYDLVKKHGL